MKKIVFNNSDDSKRLMLAIVGKSVDGEGYVIENLTRERVITPHGEEVRFANFAGIRGGSEIIITSDLPSLLEQAEYIKT